MTHQAFTIDDARLARTTYDLVAIASPTGDSAAVSDHYAALLRDLHMDVEIDAHYPGGPNVVGRWRGTGDGPRVAFVGHLDTIHAPHAPPHAADDAIHGRGADDMKGSMAAVVEAIRALRDAGYVPHGEIIVAAHSLHEAPVGKMEGLRRLLETEALGDAVLVAESVPTQHQIVTGKGQAIFSITIRRPGHVMHENDAPAGTVNAVDVAIEVAQRLRERHRELAAEGDLPMLGPETLFIGEIHGGDFYNRVPTEARIGGVRRFGPARTWAQIEAEFQAMTAPIAAATGTTIEVELASNGLGYAVPPDAPIIDALARAHQHVTGNELPVAGTKSVTDANIITSEGGIPALCYGPSGKTAHRDEEWVTIADLHRAAAVYAQFAVEYPDLMEHAGS